MSTANLSSSESAKGAPLTEKRYAIPLTLITSLFFLWAFGVNLNDVLIPHFKAAFGLSDFRSSFIQIAFFGGYFLAAFPAGRLMERIGYKRGILTGLLLCAAGALLFLPAGSLGIYGLFLFSSFVLASGQSFLEVAANPYATILGPPESGERRLNLAQSFNAVGAVFAPFVGAAFILSATVLTADQLGRLNPAELQAYRSAQTATVRLPYLVIAGTFLAVAALIYFADLPEVREQASPREADASASWRGVLSHAHLVHGVITQFLYVGAQVGVGSFVIRFVQYVEPGLGPPVYAIVLIGFFHSIMFPTIFALGIKNLGPFTKRGSSLLVMAILGAAVFPPIMGKISDLSNIQRAFFVPLLCYAYVLYFAVRGHKRAPVTEPNRILGVASSEAE